MTEIRELTIDELDAVSGGEKGFLGFMSALDHGACEATGISILGVTFTNYKCSDGTGGTVILP